MKTKSIKKKKLSELERSAYALVGSIGGRATAKKGKKYMSQIGKRGALKRWGTKNP